MTTYQHSIYMQFQALLVRVKGMEALNALSKHGGHSPQYGQEDFEAIACEIENLAQIITE